MLILSQDATEALKQAIQELDRAMDAQKKARSLGRKNSPEHLRENAGGEKSVKLFQRLSH